MALTLERGCRVEPERIKGSRFIATALPVSSEAEAKAFLAEVSEEMPDATHHCWAWRIAEPAVDRAGDAGEPSGSAGRPILAQLAGQELLDTTIVVTRYFGGTKLGVGGLVRAYGAAAAAVLEAASLRPYERSRAWLLAYDHAAEATVSRILELTGVVTTETVYGSDVTRTVQIPETAEPDLRRLLADATSGRLKWVDPS